MNTMIPMVAAPPPPKRCNLLLHCGATAVNRNQLASTPTPKATRSWQPLPHHALLETVEGVLEGEGILITGQAHGLTHDGMRYFGLLEVAPESGENTAHRVIGLRNSHDKRFSAGMVAGSQVLVCDNLCFAGEVALARKHTIRIMQELPHLVVEALGALLNHWQAHSRRIQRYQECFVSDPQVHDLVVRAVDDGVCANSYLPRLLCEWRYPRYPEFQPRNLWSLQNAFTETFKQSIEALPARTMRLHRLFDQYCGLN